MRVRRGMAGLTLIEMVVVVGLVALLSGITLYSLKPAASKSSTIGLATALADEFRSARQLAISQGFPVAIGMSTSGSEVSDSIYRLEGWNVPRVTWSTGYSGDYPSLGFAAAGWSGPSFVNDPPAPPLSKFGAFNLMQWIPAQYRGDSLLCFTPDGGVVTNGLPSLDGRFTVVVAANPSVSNRIITAGSEPRVVYVSTGGAVECATNLPGAQLAPGTATARAADRPRQALPGSARIWLSAIVIRPEAVAAPVDAFCTPGEQVTFELYAYDPEGRQLFAQWKQTGPSSGGKVGNFGFPTSTTDELTSEAERMEYLASPPSNIDWADAVRPPGGCFRARWTWTVPQDSQPGDEYTVTADVQDATGQATIRNPGVPQTFTYTTAPEGRLLAEVWNPTLGRSELVRMNRHGGGRQLLTGPDVEETMPSVDRSGTKLAFLQGPIGPGSVNQRYVKVRSLSGGGEFTIAGPGRYTTVSISPDGGWVSYRLDQSAPAGHGTLFFHRLGDDPASYSPAQNWDPNPIPPLDKEPCRTGWSPDGRYVLWATGGTGPGTHGGKIKYAELTGSGEVVNPRTLWTNNINQSQIYAPTVFDPGTGPRVLVTLSTTNPVIGHIPFEPDSPDSEGNGAGEQPNPMPALKLDLDGLGNSGPNNSSGDFDDNLGNISPDGRSVVMTRYHRASQQPYALIARWNDTVGNFVAVPGARNTIQDDIRSVVWIP